MHPQVRHIAWSSFGFTSSVEAIVYRDGSDFCAARRLPLADRLQRSSGRGCGPRIVTEQRYPANEEHRHDDGQQPVANGHVDERVGGDARPADEAEHEDEVS